MRRARLPRPLSSFVGREAFLERLERSLEANRLTTVTGPGGVGKTRASIEGARRAERLYGERIWLVDLASVLHPADLASEVARSLEVGQSASAGDDRGIAEAIGRKVREPSLLLLDNCEHLVEAAGRFAARLLDAAPPLAILATSRQPLGIPGEQVLPLPPLDATGGAEGVRLFVERAQSRDPAFAPDASQLDRVAELCRRVDSLPLAIELAASCVRSLPLEEIERRIAEGRPLPAPSGAASPERHRSLRDVVDWSYRLLSGKERSLLRRLSIFRGGCTLAGVETVCGGWDGIEGWEACDLLAGLVERSLVEPDLQPESEHARYRLLETIRVVAANRLSEQPAEEAELLSRYLAHAASLVLLRPGEKGPLRGAWVQRIEPDYRNLVHALDLSLEAGRLDLAFAIADPLSYYWVQTGHWTEGAGWLDRLLEARRPEPSLEVPTKDGIEGPREHKGGCLLYTSDA
ncbi:MAG: AfsR/SARP family transcriptional regulator, partial [Candidatus Eisenbacteria bacterium]|nr:AfsR/SARP family transcriptional regulator [Candidatus Eisenbacteria bacterium]